VDRHGAARRTKTLVIVSLLPVALLFAACAGETEPAGNVTSDAVDLKAKGSWQPGETGAYWFEFAPTGSSSWTRTTARSFGPMPNSGSAALTEKLRPSCSGVSGSCTEAALAAHTTYRFRLCGYLTAPSAVGSDSSPFCMDSNGSISGTAYDSFTTAAVEPPPPPPDPSWFDVTRNGSTYTAQSRGGPSYTGTLKQVVDSAVGSLKAAGGGTINFGAGEFNLGSDWLKLRGLAKITFQGQGIDATTIRNDTSVAADTEVFDVGSAFEVTIRDLAVDARGAFRSTSDAIDFDGGNDTVIERVKITSSRGRGIVLDGKDVVNGVARSAERNTIKNCVVTGTPSDGIELLAASRNRVEGCTVRDVGGHGIQLTKSSSGGDQPNKPSSHNVVTGNAVNNSGQDGINLNASSSSELRGNTVLNSSDDVASKDGIRIGTADSIACDDNVVSNNTSSDDQTVHTQRYGLYIASALCNRTVVSGNTFSGNLVAPIKDLGTGTQIG
jgi:parallel beta-helix repeat protein